jgi:hypothetical protein
MDMIQPVPQTTLPALVSAPAALIIFMLMIHHAQLVQPIAKAAIAIVMEVSAMAVLIAIAKLTVVIVVVNMVTAAAGSAVFQKPVVLLTAIARTACVILPGLIALINAPPTIVQMVSVLIMLKPTAKRIAANWTSPKERSFPFLMTIRTTLLMPRI